MKPVLYDELEKTFESNGLGILNDAIKSPVTEELNGQFELMMQYPITGIHYEEIALRRIILAKPDPVRSPQPFRIYRISKPINGIVTVYARHIAYDLLGIPVSPFTVSGVQSTLQNLKTKAITHCPFSFSTDKQTSAKMTVGVPKTIWSLLGGSEGSVLDVYRGEWEFDRFDVRLWNHRGTDRGVTIRYGKNLTDLEQDENCANCYTGVCPYWTSYDGDTVMLPEKIVKAPGTYTYERILPLDLSCEWNDRPTESQLKTRAERYIRDNSIGIPKVSLKVKFVSLDQTDEYKDLVLLERVLLGDTVSVSFAKLGVDAMSRVVKTQYDPITERYIQIYLGSVKSNIADTIVHQQQQIEQTPSMTDLEKAKAAATAWLTNGRGYKVERRDEHGNTVDTLYLDKPDINQAVNVLRVGQSGIGFSRSGVNGPYVSAWTLDGKFNAGFIQTGELNANLIKTGVIESIDGSVKMDLSNGQVVVDTRIEGKEGRFVVDSLGINGYGYDIISESYYHSLIIDPGGRKRVQVPEPTLISSKDAPGGLRVCGGAGPLWLGDPSSVVDISGKIRLDGKLISWRENSDGTYSLVGTIGNIK